MNIDNITNINDIVINGKIVHVTIESCSLHVIGCTMFLNIS